MSGYTTIRPTFSTRRHTLPGKSRYPLRGASPKSHAENSFSDIRNASVNTAESFQPMNVRVLQDSAQDQTGGPLPPGAPQGNTTDQTDQVPMIGESQDDTTDQTDQVPMIDEPQYNTTNQTDQLPMIGESQDDTTDQTDQVPSTTTTTVDLLPDSENGDGLEIGDFRFTTLEIIGSALALCFLLLLCAKRKPIARCARDPYNYVFGSQPTQEALERKASAAYRNHLCIIEPTFRPYPNGSNRLTKSAIDEINKSRELLDRLKTSDIEVLRNHPLLKFDRDVNGCIVGVSRYRKLTGYYPNNVNEAIANIVREACRIASQTVEAPEPAVGDAQPSPGDEQPSPDPELISEGARQAIKESARMSNLSDLHKSVQV
jgi:hypothetical protein